MQSNIQVINTNKYLGCILLMAASRMWPGSLAKKLSHQKTIYSSCKCSLHETGFVCTQSSAHFRVVRTDAAFLLLVCNSCNWIVLNTVSHKVDRITGFLNRPGGSASIRTTATARVTVQTALMSKTLHSDKFPQSIPFVNATGGI